MHTWNTVAIVGVGLIGGSLGMALRRRGLTRRVIGIGRRSASLKRAQVAGAIDEATTNLVHGVREAELVVVCVPVLQIVDFARQAAENCPAGALITDVGSTKESICAELSSDLGRGVAFIGSHPLAGGEKGGVEFASADLFEARTVVVTPGRRAKGEQRAAISRLWESVGARVVSMTPAAHDAALAATSHVPHLVAAALAAATPESLLSLVAGGWGDTTRIAAGDAELWRQILADNRVHVLKALGKFERLLSRYRRALEEGDEARLQSLLEAGKKIRDALGS